MLKPTNHDWHTIHLALVIAIDSEDAAMDSFTSERAGGTVYVPDEYQEMYKRASERVKRMKRLLNRLNANMPAR